MRIAFAFIAIVGLVSSVAAAYTLRGRSDETAPWKKAVLEGTYIRLPASSKKPAVRVAEPTSSVPQFTIPPPPEELPNLPPPAVTEPLRP